MSPLVQRLSRGRPDDCNAGALFFWEEATPNVRGCCGFIRLEEEEKEAYNEGDYAACKIKALINILL